MTLKLYKNSDMLLRVAVGNLNKTDAAPTAITSVSASILTEAGATVSGSAITPTVDASDDQIYWGEFDNNVPLTDATDYSLNVVVVADGKTVVARPPARAGYYGAF